MIVFKKFKNPAHNKPLNVPHAFLQALRKALSEPPSMASWPSFLPGVESMHERVPVFFPHNTSDLVTLRQATPIVGQHDFRGLVHFGSDDRFIAQWALTHLLQSQRNAGARNLLTFDCETTGVNTGNSRDSRGEPSYPYQIGFHDPSGSGLKTTSYTLKLPEDITASVDALLATNRSKKGYLFWKTPLIDIQGSPSLAGLAQMLSALNDGDTYGPYRREDVGDTVRITHTDYDHAKTFEEAYGDLSDLSKTHAFMAFNCPFDSKMLHRLASHLGKRGAFKNVTFIDLLRPYSRIVGLPSMFARDGDTYNWAALPRASATDSHEAGADSELLWDLFHHLATVPPNIWSQDPSNPGASQDRSEQLRRLWGVVRFAAMQNEKGMVDRTTMKQLEPERLTGEQRESVLSEFARGSDASNHYKNILSSYYDGLDHYFDGFWDFVRSTKLRDPQHALKHPFHRTADQDGSGPITVLEEMLGNDYDELHDHTRWRKGSGDLRQQDVAQGHQIVRMPALLGETNSLAPTRTVQQTFTAPNARTGFISTMSVGPLGHRPVRNLATIAHLFMQTRPMIVKDNRISLVPVHEITSDHQVLSLPRPEAGPTQWVVTANYSKELHAHLLDAISKAVPLTEKKSAVAKDLWKITDNHAADTLSGTPPSTYLPPQPQPHHTAELILGATLIPAMHQLAVTHGLDPAAVVKVVHGMIGAAGTPPHQLCMHPLDRPRSPTAPSPI